MSIQKKCLFVALVCISTLCSSPILSENFVFTSPPFKSCHASTIVELDNGDLLCAFFAGDNEGAKDVGIWMCRFHKDQWQQPILIASDPLHEPCWNPVLFKLGRELLLFYKVGPTPKTWSGVLKRSFNEGNTWEKEEMLPAGIFGPIKNKPFLTQENVLLCGSSHESYMRWGCYVDKTEDGGKTWNKGSPINLPNDFFGMIQPTIIKISKNTLLLLARTRTSGFIAQSKSFDGGKTWQEPSLTKLKNPNSGIDAITLKDGRLILVYNDSNDNRYPLNVALSEDDGNSWKNIIALESEEGEFSYPAVIQTKDGKIVVTYTWNRTLIKEIVLDEKKL